MTLPGIGVALAIGTALAGFLYLLYQQSNAPIQQGYGGSDREHTYSWQPEPAPEPPKSRKRVSSKKRRKPDVCSICLDSGSKEDSVTLECDHSFHKICLDMWLESKNSCPNCRRKV